MLNRSAKELFAYYSSHPELTFPQLLDPQYKIDPNISSDHLLSWIDQHQLQVTLFDTLDPLWEKVRPNITMLSWIGNFDLLQQPILSIVGPRVPSLYAQKILKDFFYSARQYQLVTISGGARGIDQMAHQLSLQYKIPTIVVLGGGIKRYREQSSRTFLQKILDAGGLILSEFKLDFKPTNRSFPQRNRIVAGLGQMLFLPEASLQSGSMISVEYAYQMQRPVYSVPNALFAEQSVGIFTAYQEKKLHFTFDFYQLLSQYFALRYDRGDEDATSMAISVLPPEEQIFLQYFAQSPKLSLEELVGLNKGNYTDTLQLLTALELSGLIYQSSPNRYQRV